jgi:hypothetical protein
MPEGGGATTVEKRVVDVAAERATGYGERAVAQGTRVAEAPAKRGARAAVAGCRTAAHVCRARAAWAKQFTGDRRLEGVRIGDLGTFARTHARARPSVGALEHAGFLAWTDSSTRVLVHPDLVRVDPEDTGAVRAPDWFVRVVLCHEAEHVLQFRGNGGTPPDTYREAVGFEARAYAKSAAQCRDLVVPAEEEPVRAWAERLFGGTASLCRDRLASPVDEVADAAWFVELGLLPPHTGGIGSFYVR